MTNEWDKELDDLEKELRGKPFVHEPDELNIPEGAVCWLNMDRLCRGDCIAFNIGADAASGPERCMLLVYMSEQTASSQMLVQIGRLAAQGTRTNREDDIRQKAASIPVPEVK